MPNLPLNLHRYLLLLLGTLALFSLIAYTSSVLLIQPQQTSDKVVADHLLAHDAAIQVMNDISACQANITCKPSHVNTYINLRKDFPGVKVSVTGTGSHLAITTTSRSGYTCQYTAVSLEPACH